MESRVPIAPPAQQKPGALHDTSMGALEHRLEAEQGARIRVEAPHRWSRGRSGGRLQCLGAWPWLRGARRCQVQHLSPVLYQPLAEATCRPDAALVKLGD